MTDIWGHGDPVKVAQEASEKVRELNHTTLNAKEMSAPEINRTVQALLELVERLPQTFEQLRDHLAMQQSAGRVRMENSSNPDSPVTYVHLRLSQAAALCEGPNRVQYGTEAGPLAAALHEASGWLYNMGAAGGGED